MPLPYPTDGFQAVAAVRSSLSVPGRAPYHSINLPVMTSGSPPETSAWPFGEYALAAVVFTDVVGFSLRVGEDERHALSLLYRDFERMRPFVGRYHGHLLKTMGDGQLLCFPCANNAVNCAIDMQLALAEAGRNLPQDEVLLHRIGIHLGDVFVSSGDVNGNGVNIASRLQGRAEPGGICISQTVYDVVKHQRHLKVTYLGAQDLKNIRDSIHLYQIVPEPAADDPAGSPTAVTPTAVGLTGSVSRERPMPRAVPRTAREPFRVAILGDFSGRESRGVVEPWLGRPDQMVDTDQMERILARVELRLPAWRSEGGWLDLRFKSLEDFHPDRIARQVAPLGELANLRRRLLAADPGATAEAEARFRLLPVPSSPAAGGGRPGDPNSVDAIVKRLFGAPAGAASAEREAELLELVEAEMSGHLRAVLGHPDFQRLEAAWTGLAELVNRFCDEDEVRFHLVDVSKAELLADLLGGSEPGAGLRQLLERRPWGALIGCQHFAAVPEDLAALEILAEAVAAAGTPFIAAAESRFAGCESFHGEPDPREWNHPLPADCQKRWLALRQSPGARFLALAAPRFLLRAPYGPGNDPIELFPFSELPPGPIHESLHWGNPAWLIAHALCEAFVDEGWSFSTRRSAVVEDRPLHKFTADGESQVTPWAEAWLTERAAATLLERGLIPLLSVADRNAIRIPALQSAAIPPQALAGPWTAMGG